MIEECARRWPGLMYTDPCTKSGEGFYETLPEFDLTAGPYSLGGPTVPPTPPEQGGKEDPCGS